MLHPDSVSVPLGALVSISLVRVKSSALPVSGASGSRSSWSTLIGDAEEDWVSGPLRTFWMRDSVI